MMATWFGIDNITKGEMLWITDHSEKAHGSLAL